MVLSHCITTENIVEKVSYESSVENRKHDQVEGRTDEEGQKRQAKGYILPCIQAVCSAIGSQFRDATASRKQSINLQAIAHEASNALFSNKLL